MKQLAILLIFLFSFNANSECVYGDCFNGQGTYITPNGKEYIGEWKDGKMNGKGKYTWTNGTVYSGEWKDGKMHGKGYMTYKEGDRYLGDFKNNKRHGKGTYTYSDGEKVTGTFKNGELVEEGSTFGDILIEAVAEGLVDGLVEKAIGCDEDVRVRHRTRSHPLGERNETIVYKEDC